ncbi:hypothetical protein K439DRAFT_1660705 [Ramaria rubella]|nr:hypothetical protein K439DRAFT_1660705 [Ramaria rubella]
MEPRVIALVRYALLGTLLLFSLITLGLSGHLIGTIPTGDGFLVPDYLALDLAIAVITLVVVIPAIVIDIFRKGAFTSMVAVELGWCFILWVLWIAAAGDTAAARAGADCNFVDETFSGEFVTDNTLSGECHEAQALIGFTWLNFIIFLYESHHHTVLGWLVSLLTFSVTAHTRGNTSVWTKPVTGTDFFAGGSGVPQQQQQYGGPMQQQYTGQPQYTGTPPVQQQAYPQPASYPPTGYTATPPPGAGQV